MDYFLQNFPEIDNISGKLRIMEQAGYLPIAHFVLPEYCWVVNYYAQMETFGYVFFIGQKCDSKPMEG